MPGGGRAHPGDLDGVPGALRRRREFLFGRFSIADAMFAPVVLRFQTYEVALAGAARAYAETMLALPAMQAWVADALAEPERIEMFERG
jgi:glutathione S-transferase